MPLLGHPFRLFLATGQTLAMAHVLWKYGYSVAPGSGPSMLPTFLVWNEWFVADRSYRRGRGVRVGDCVTYTIPVEPHEDGVKRVIGMPGDYVLLNSPGSKNDDMMQVSLSRPKSLFSCSYQANHSWFACWTLHNIC